MKSMRMVWLLRGGVLAALAALLVVGFGSMHGTAEAGGGTIFIEKRDRETNELLPGSCFDVLSDTQALIFNVCDNQSPDLDPLDGMIQVATGASAVHHVVETVAPEGYNLKTDKYECDNSAGTCTVVALNDEKKVGGVVELAEAAGTPLEAAGSSSSNAGLIAGIVAAIAAGTVTLGGAAWYTRRRWG